MLRRGLLLAVLLCAITGGLSSQETGSAATPGDYRGGAPLINMPYYASYGWLNRWGDLEVFFPYIGIGLQATNFSIAWYALTGLNVYYKNLSWRLEYLQGLIPDISLFDYKNLEYYAQNIFSYDFSGFRISSLTRFGRILYGFHSAEKVELTESVFTDFGLRQIFSLDAQIYNDDLTILTGTYSLGFDYVPRYHQNSVFFKLVMPLTLDFVHSKLGFMGTLFHTAYLSPQRPIVIGERYSGYDAAKSLTAVHNGSLYTNMYHLYGALDLIYRIYLSGLPTPYNRFYFALGGNVGFGSFVEDGRTDLLYMGTAAFGYELYDSIPFEIRFSVDQDGVFFLNINVVSPLSHRADSRPK